MVRLWNLISWSVAITLAIMVDFVVCNQQGLNHRPIIGIVAYPVPDPVGVLAEYIAASYVKWVESAGGRVVPIPYDSLSLEELDKLFQSISGLLFQGGKAELNGQAKYLYHKAIQANRDGIYFPIWGTCLGLEWLLTIESNDFGIFDHEYDANNVSLPVSFTSHGLNRTSNRMFRSASKDMMETLTTKNVTLNAHHLGIRPEDFYNHPVLNNFFSVLATGVDLQGYPFVSVVEARNYPFYGVMFHPEKNIFEWGTYPDSNIPFAAIDHSFEAMQMSQYFANFFVEETRKNIHHKFDSPMDEKKSLIYNYHTNMLMYPRFEQTYFFQEKAYYTSP